MDSAAPPSLSNAAAAPPGSQGPWPTAYSRRRHAPDTASVVDPADATAWSMPYTDLTMLLMVFFVVMLSVVGPRPSDVSHEDTTREGGAAVNRDDQLSTEGGIGDRQARTLIDGGNGILLEDVGIMPDGGSHEQVEEGIKIAQADEEANSETNAATRASQRDQARAETEMAEDAFAAAWARRVTDLETAASEFLDESDLEKLINLQKTDTGIELRLPEDSLFTSGSADLQTEGLELLTRVTPFLTEVTGDIQISGHTDNVPIQTTRFPSNWELSAARAIAVVRLLQHMGIAESKMQAVGHGANRPIASNSHAAGRAINRRVTIEVKPLPTASTDAP